MYWYFQSNQQLPLPLAYTLISCTIILNPITFFNSNVISYLQAILKKLNSQKLSTYDHATDGLIPNLAKEAIIDYTINSQQC